MAPAAAACQEQLRENQRSALGAIQPCLPLRILDRNPIRLVRQGAKRRSTPSVPTPLEIKLLLNVLRLVAKRGAKRVHKCTLLHPGWLQ
jgi:hypothetical protein